MIPRETAGNSAQAVLNARMSPSCSGLRLRPVGSAASQPSSARAEEHHPLTAHLSRCSIATSYSGANTSVRARERHDSLAHAGCHTHLRPM